MPRSKNIVKITYHNFMTGDEYINIRHDKIKVEQDGENIRVRHV